MDFLIWFVFFVVVASVILTQAAQSFVSKKKWIEKKRGDLDRRKTIVAYQVHKIDDFFLNVQQARK